MGPHGSDMLLVGTVRLELAVRNTGEKTKGLSEHRRIKPRVVLHEKRFELPLVVTTTDMYGIHIKEIARGSPVEERVHLSRRRIVRVQDGSDIEGNRVPGPPEDAEVYLADFAVRSADHHLDEIGRTTGDRDTNWCLRNAATTSASTSAGPPWSALKRSMSSEGRAAIP